MIRRSFLTKVLKVSAAHLFLPAILLACSGGAVAADAAFLSSHFSGSQNCAFCHDGLTDNSGTDVSIAKDWGTSMMANATRDPFWRAKVATELERNPHLAEVINDKCSTCHAPMANYEMKLDGAPITILGDGSITDPLNPYHDAAMEGVSCTLCHQITDDATLGTPDGFTGQYNINDTKTIYGQYANIFANPMINNTGYTPVYSAHISTSEVCATCHELTTPYVNAEGIVMTDGPETEFPEQTPYTEWQNSIFADTASNPQSCQDCHMPQTTAKISNRPRWLEAKDKFAKHHLVGANTTMLTMLRDNAAALGVASNNMDLSIDRARAMLQSSVVVEIVSANVAGGILEAKVKLTNNSGHKTPTSYPSRRMWLNFRVTDSNNNVVFESGRITADGSIVGADNDADQTQIEPHYNLITLADQVQIYETIMGNSDNEVTYTLLRAAQYLKDNRLTPKGFDKGSVPPKVGVYGDAISDVNFNMGSDEVTYRIPLSVSGNLRVQVDLNYQTIMHGFVQDLYKKDSNGISLPEVTAFKEMYQAQSLKHELITSAQTTVVSDGGGLPTPAPVVTISATPATIDQGQSATLNWSSTDANSCTASGAWSGSKATSGSEAVYPTETATYTLTCNGGGGSSVDSATVTVNQPPVAVGPTLSLSATPSSVRVGGIITLSWSSTDANSCAASGDWSGDKSTSGRESMSISISSTFTLTCTGGDGGIVSSSVSYMKRGRRWLDLQ